MPLTILGSKHWSYKISLTTSKPLVQIIPKLTLSKICLVSLKTVTKVLEVAKETLIDACLSSMSPSLSLNMQISLRNLKK